MKTPVLEIMLTAEAQSLMKAHKLSQRMVFELYAMHIHCRAMVNLNQARALMRRGLTLQAEDGGFDLTRQGRRLTDQLVAYSKGIDPRLIYFKLDYKIMFPT